MSAFDDANDLIRHAESVFATIRQVYEASLQAKVVSRTLRVEIKNVLENLRSALDFAAREIFDRYGSSQKAHPKIYFPYATASQDRATFEKSGRIETCIPGLSTSRPDIVEALLEMQHFGSRRNTWLPDFMDLTNENKHERLTPQVRRESRKLRISDRGASFDIGEGGSVSIAPGGSISVGGAVIRGQQSFGVGNPPRVEGGNVETITWVSFHFESTGQPVLPFLESALKGTNQIVTELAGKQAG